VPQIDPYIFTELSKMIAGKQSPEQAVKAIAEKSDEATGN
jgi:multiple sugar transport system substrate-binding protein